MRREAVTHPQDDAVVQKPAGFLGERVRTIAECRDGAHVVRFAEYRFTHSASGGTAPYVELFETHDRNGPGVLMAVSTLVHLAQNATAAEVWDIGTRALPVDAMGAT